MRPKRKTSRTRGRGPFVVTRAPAVNRFRWTPALLKLLGKVSDPKVAKRGRVSLAVVAKERKRRGIPAANPHREAVKWTTSMIRRLGADSDARVAAELRVLPNTVTRKRRLLGIPPHNPPARAAEEDGAWTGEEEALLGTRSDRRVAKRLRRSLNVVSLRRRILGIPAFAPNRPKFVWSKRCIAKLGKKTDRALAKELDILPATVKQKRLELGIPPRYEARRVVVTKELERLLRLPPTIARRRTGLKLETIQKLRGELGIEAPRLADVPWTRAAIAKLGTMPDAQLARELGLGITSVNLRRKKLGIPTFRNWRRWTPAELRLLRSNLSVRAIAAKLRRTPQSVRAKRRVVLPRER